MNTNQMIPIDLYYSNILPYIFEYPEFDLRLFLKNALVNSWWHNLIYSYDFINVLLKCMDIKRPNNFNNIISPKERMKIALNKIYIHDISLVNNIIPLGNSAYDLVISNSFEIRGNIEDIQLYMEDNQQSIDLELINNIDYNYLSQVDIYTCNPHFPDNIHLWKLEMYLGYEEMEWCKTIHLFSTNKPNNYNFRIRGNCKIKEVDMNTQIQREYIQE